LRTKRGNPVWIAAALRASRARRDVGRIHAREKFE
jgi:hypothetical protein